MTVSDSAPSRAATLAAQLRQATADVLLVAEACDAAQWRIRCANEERSVGVLVHHLGTMSIQVADLVRLIQAGQPTPPLTQAMVDHANARHAAEFANVAQGPTIAFLRENNTVAATLVETLTDAELERTTPLPVLGTQSASAAEIIEYLLIGHSLGHLASIQAALQP